MNPNTVEAMVPLSPTADVPDWLDFLTLIGARAASLPVNPPRRLLLGLPTAVLGAAAVTAGAVSGLMRLRKEHALDLPTSADVGARVSVFQSGYFCDTVLRAVEDDRISTPTVTLTKNLDIVRRLPEGFPHDRRDRRLKSESAVVEVWQVASDVGDEATRVYARVSATPVVVIGHRNVVAEQVDELAELFPRVGSFLDTGRGLNAWFRHPVIVCSPQARPPEWWRGLQPSLVVCDGAAAWNSPLRLAFPDAAHILVLDRRSQAAVVLSRDIRASHPDTHPFAPLPPAGVEAWRIGELRVEPPSDDEDLF